jgi:MFS family permease
MEKPHIGVANKNIIDEVKPVLVTNDLKNPIDLASQNPSENPASAGYSKRADCRIFKLNELCYNGKMMAFVMIDLYSILATLLLLSPIEDLWIGARFMQGMCGGLNLILTTVFIQEFSPKECLNDFSFFIPISIFLGQVLGTGSTICIDKYGDADFLNSYFSILTLWRFLLVLVVVV